MHSYSISCERKYILKDYKLTENKTTSAGNNDFVVNFRKQRTCRGRCFQTTNSLPCLNSFMILFLNCEFDIFMFYKRWIFDLFPDLTGE